MIEFGSDRKLELSANRGRFRVDQVDRSAGAMALPVTLNAANAADQLRRGLRVVIPADAKLLFDTQTFLAASGHVIR